MTILKFLPRFQKAYRSFDKLEAREQWSRSEIEDFQLQRVNAVWEHAIQHVPYYRRIQSELHLPTRFTSLNDYSSSVPLLSKHYLRDNTKEFLSEQHKPGKWHRTSGSTNTPLKAFRGNDAHLEMLRTNYRYYRMWGHDIFDRMVYLWMVGTRSTYGWRGKVYSLREYIEDTLRNRLRLSALTLGKEDLQHYLKKISAFQPSALFAYTQSAYLLALEAKEQGFKCPSLKVINLTSEPVSEHVIKTIEDAFNAPCIVQYGCVEFGYIAGHWPDRTLRVREDINFVETLPREDGHYDVVLTCLNNPSFPLLRYDIGDVTDRPLESPAQGFSILGTITGRCGDFIYTPAGRCLHPIVMEALFKKNYFQYVRRYQIRQRADYSLLALVELIDPQTVLDKRLLSKQLSHEAEGCPVEVQFVSDIKLTAAGKHQNVVSEVAREFAYQ